MRDQGPGVGRSLASSEDHGELPCTAGKGGPFLQINDLGPSLLCRTHDLLCCAAALHVDREIDLAYLQIIDEVYDPAPVIVVVMAFFPTKASAVFACSDSESKEKADLQSARISDRSLMEPSAFVV